MNAVIHVAEGTVREALIKAEDDLLARTGHRFFFKLDQADEVGLRFSVARDDRAEATFDVLHPRLQGRQTWSARSWLRGEMDKIVETLSLGIVEEEPAQPEPEQRFETVIIFTARPDIVLTPPGGVLADEATRVYRHFRDGAAAIGGRCFTAPVEAA